MSDRNKKMTEIAEKIATIPVSDVIAMRLDITRRGTNSAAACPWCDDDVNERGHFKITDTKGIYKCFKCGKAGNAATFLRDYDGISYVEALATIGREFGVLSSEDISFLTKKKNSEDFKVVAERIYREISEDNPRADNEHLNYVYNIMKKGQSLEHGSKPILSEEHRKYLNDRGIDDDRIKQNEYFTFPNRKAMGKILKILDRRGMSAEHLLGVPGFYFDTKKDKVTFAYSKKNKGIGIPIYDADKNIVAIQIRRDVIEKGDQRYTWFSSAFAHEKEEFGTSPGAPINVCRPKGLPKSKTLFITEGHFKADELVNRYSCIALSVQGVGNWNGISNVIDKVKDEYESLRNIYIAFDADMSSNINVANQAIKLGQELMNKFRDINVFYLLWDDNIAKGIDDLLLTEYGEKKLFRARAREFIKAYNDMKYSLMKEFEVPNDYSLTTKVISDKLGKDESKQYIYDKYMEFVFYPLRLTEGKNNPNIRKAG